LIWQVYFNDSNIPGLSCDFPKLDVQVQTNRVPTVSEVFSHLRSNHRQILSQWLSSHSEFRPAVEADCDRGELEFWREEIHAHEHPYYSVGDFNADGDEDFAVILLAGQDEAALIVFNGPFTRANPAYFERHFERDGIYIVYDHVVSKRLFLGILEGDSYCMTLIPRGRGYTYKDCEQ